MTTVPNDPVSTPPANKPSMDPAAPEPEIPKEDEEPTEEELQRGRAAALETELPEAPT